MRYILLLSFLASIVILSCTPKHAYPIEASKKNEDHSRVNTDQKKLFPKDWLGYWEGDLEIFDSTGLKQKIPMALDISRTDSSGIYNWVILYGQDSTQQKRAYELKELDTKAGHYLIDEKNGIFIDIYHIKNEMTSIFEVMDNTLIISYKRENEYLEFTVKMFPSKEHRTTGGLTEGKEEVPVVKSFQYKIGQFARLNKKCLVE